MIFEKNWKDYALIDVSDGKRLERWGGYIFIRPDPQIIWTTEKDMNLWSKFHAEYIRYKGGNPKSGGGKWRFCKPVPENFTIEYEPVELRFKIMPMGFKHMGLFPEQAVNWNYMYGIIKQQAFPVNVLNLFAYTGGATIACAKAGASVCHVDASKGMIAYAKENAVLSGIPDNHIRYIADDCIKFVEREQRRGKRYDAVILDPPSYGRGKNGEMWKIEDDLYKLLCGIKAILSDNPLFILINLYTAGLAPSCAGYMLNLIMRDFGGVVTSDEIGLIVEKTKLPFPCGSFSRWERIL